MTTTARAPRRDATENRAALIAAARLELNIDPDASLDTIAARANLTRRAVYGHFATRDDLVRELISLGAARIAASLGTLDHTDPVVRLALITSRLWQEVQHIRVMAVFAVRGPLQRHTAAALEPIRQMVRDAIADSVNAGRARTDIAPGSLARLVEDAVLAGFAEATREALDDEDGERLVMLLALGTIGLGAVDAAHLIDSHHERNAIAEARETAGTPRSTNATGS